MKNETISPQESRDEEVLKDPKYSFVIFDFHGTLTDHQLRSIKAIHTAGHTAFDTHFDKSFFQNVLTRPSKQSGNGMTSKEFFDQKFEDKNAEEKDKFWESYKDGMDKLYIPIPGIKRVIKTLIRSGVDVSVLTNGKNRQIIQEELVKWGLPQLAESLYSSHITGVKKPDPQAVQHIINDRLEAGKPTDLSSTLLIGDYMDDTKVAHNIGVDSLLLVRGNGWEVMKLKEPRPTHIATDALDILRVIEGKHELHEGETYTIQPLLWPKEKWGKTAQ